MKALICPSLGPVDGLAVMDVDPPVAQEGEVVVDVACAALNFFDTLIIEGKYQIRPEPPFSPAGEFAGRIAAVGPGVTGFGVGDRVMATTGYGAAREQIAVPARSLVPVPDGLPLDKAAGLAITYGTTLHAYRQRARLDAGETVAVLGASGGVGLAAVEIGALLGAKVIACASSDDKLAFVKRYGAAETINYRTEDFRARLKEITGGRGVDVVYDPVGGALSEPALRAMAWKGRFLVIGFASGEIPKIPLNLALLKGCDIIGVFWGAFTEREPEAHRDNLSMLLKWAETGALSVHIHAKFPLERFREAFASIARREALGKTLLTFREASE